MSDTTYVYGENNGASYDDDRLTVDDDGTVKAVLTTPKTHWDPRIQVRSVAHTVEVGIVPPTPTTDGVEPGSVPDDTIWNNAVWLNENGQFLSLSRDGLNRLIAALQEAGAATYGHDRW